MSMSLTPPPAPRPLKGLGEGGRGERAALKKDVDVALMLLPVYIRGEIRERERLARPGAGKIV